MVWEYGDAVMVLSRSQSMSVSQYFIVLYHCKAGALMVFPDENTRWQHIIKTCIKVMFRHKGTFKLYSAFQKHTTGYAHVFSSLKGNAYFYPEHVAYGNRKSKSGLADNSKGLPLEIYSKYRPLSQGKHSFI